MFIVGKSVVDFLKAHNWAKISHEQESGGGGDIFKDVNTFIRKNNLHDHYNDKDCKI